VVESEVNGYLTNIQADVPCKEVTSMRTATKRVSSIRTAIALAAFVTLSVAGLAHGEWMEVNVESAGTAVNGMVAEKTSYEQRSETSTDGTVEGTTSNRYESKIRGYGSRTTTFYQFVTNESGDIEWVQKNIHKEEDKNGLFVPINLLFASEKIGTGFARFGDGVVEIYDSAAGSWIRVEDTDHNTLGFTDDGRLVYYMDSQGSGKATAALNARYFRLESGEGTQVEGNGDGFLDLCPVDGASGQDQQQVSAPVETGRQTVSSQVTYQGKYSAQFSADVKPPAPAPPAP